ncbi:MAG TPA: hypothetical protein VFR90_13015 [Methylibium sp.]|uniref:hypothetical protein n=1 Tax=Methylibium sp. TaxID=2067992 RepID=UPI002DBAAA7D|nr:hypothetical protein [Methylibium sp.]HEU4460036.1 hypothetical protein [Methylibium sp.]
MKLSELLKDMLHARDPAHAALDIDIDRLVSEARPAAPPRDGIWRESSYELQRGLEVSEEPLDSLPAELIDAFREG